MSETVEDTGAKRRRIVLVTGASGAGRATALNVFEDLGFEPIDNLPLSLVEPLLAAPPRRAPLVLGIDVRNRDFSTDAMLALLSELEANPEVDAALLFLDCRADVLLRRYSETRRRHPLAPSETPDVGIARELELLAPVRSRAEYLIDTSELTVHDLRAEIEHLFDKGDGDRMTISVESFSYKRGLPRGVDMVLDVRFLANPHWEPELRGLDGRDGAVQAYVRDDARFSAFFDHVLSLTELLLPAFREEGKSYLTLAFGCTGGQHRSVALAEFAAAALAEAGWRVSTRHRELERRGLTAPEAQVGSRK